MESQKTQNCPSNPGEKERNWRHSPFRFQIMFSSVSFSRVRLFVTPWITARQASLSITNSWSLLKLMSIESVMPSSHLILSHPLLLLPPIPPSIRVFSNESTLRMRWPKYWSFSFSIIQWPTKNAQLISQSEVINIWLFSQVIHQTNNFLGFCQVN